MGNWVFAIPLVIKPWYTKYRYSKWYTTGTPLGPASELGPWPENYIKVVQTGEAPSTYIKAPYSYLPVHIKIRRFSGNTKPAVNLLALKIQRTAILHQNTL